MRWVAGRRVPGDSEPNSRSQAPHSWVGLRRDVRWQDGVRFTAADVIYAYLPFKICKVADSGWSSWIPASVIATSWAWSPAQLSVFRGWARTLSSEVASTTKRWSDFGLTQPMLRYATCLDRRQGLLRAKVVSPSPLPSRERRSVRRHFHSRGNPIARPYQSPQSFVFFTCTRNDRRLGALVRLRG